ncbi:copper chaperone PCu(A)C [Marinobacter sp. M-5]|jgi:copper(I)-binding protein|uniref:copper chaperone PCu(A)C n=1 Tax=Marinobacter sp. M-5 TaxID=3081089 RepID=UPI00293C4C9B|nr:copper chaperone PCu(A)C [Marinobacter sp. M-5]MDV3504965.1 copper chaperone PCu(A)C [Marinobacter sp. M-5]
MTRRKHLAAGLLLACTTMTTPYVTADHHSHGTVVIENPWSRPTPPGSPMGVGYMTLTNTGDSEITFTAAETPRAANVSIHQSIMNDGVMSMQPLKNGLTIPGGETVELKPHGYHLMLEQLEGPLKAGEAVPMTLSFDGADSLKVELTVRSLDGKPLKPQEKNGMHGHGHH